MRRKSLTAAILTAAGFSGLAAVQANAQDAQAGPAEAQMFLSVPIKLDLASQIARQAASGELAAIGFNDENGSAVYEASVVRKDGSVTVLKIDAQNGKVLGTVSGQSIGSDHADGEHESQDGGADGEQQDG